MTKLLLVTGNEHKLKEWQRMMPANVQLGSRDVELAEIQSSDPLEIVVDKAKRAYAIVGQPLIVEDVSAGLDKLKGLPGPFIKFFNKEMGPDALYRLAGSRDGEPAAATCSAVYYDGTSLITAQETVRGTVVSPRGEGFGFDIVFMPDGSEQTFSEMGPDKKDMVSHRGLAIRNLLSQLKDASII